MNALSAANYPDRYAYLALLSTCAADNYSAFVLA